MAVEPHCSARLATTYAAASSPCPPPPTDLGRAEPEDSGGAQGVERRSRERPVLVDVPGLGSDDVVDYARERILVSHRSSYDLGNLSRAAGHPGGARPRSPDRARQRSFNDVARDHPLPWRRSWGDDSHGGRGPPVRREHPEGAGRPDRSPAGGHGTGPAGDAGPAARCGSRPRVVGWRPARAGSGGRDGRRAAWSASTGRAKPAGFRASPGPQGSPTRGRMVVS